jgi:PAS domain S-box-containing protein
MSQQGASSSGPDFRLLLDAQADAVLAADRDRRILFANAAAERLLGWPTAELVGQSLDAVLPGGLGDGNGRVHRSRADSVAVVRRRDGTELPVEVSVADAAGGPEGGGLVATLREPRDRDELEHHRNVARYLRATTRAAATLAARLDQDRVLTTAAETLVSDFDSALARIWLADEATGELKLRAYAGPAQEGAWGHLADSSPSALPALAEVVRSRAPLVRTDLADDPAYNRDWLARQSIASMAILPMVCADRVLGVIVHYTRRPLPAEVVDALGAFAAIVAASLNDVRLLAREQAARVETEEHRRRLQSALDVLPVGVLVAEGPDGRITLANPAAEEIGGGPMAARSIDEFVANHAISHLDGRPYEPADRPLWRALRGGERVRETLRFRRADGAEVVLDVSTSPFPGPSGGAVAAFRDVSAQLRTESALADRAAQLKALLDHLPVGVAYFDSVGICRACNGPAHATLGHPREEIVGSTAIELFARAEGLRDALVRCIRQLTPHVQEGVPWPDPSGEGPLRYLDWRFEPIHSDPSKPRGALALIIDVTDRTRAESELQQAKEAAEQASRNKTQFLSAVSHDLRTPVNALSLQADLLSRLIAGRADTDEDLTLLAGDIRHAAANLIELINDLLDLTRFDSGHVEHHPSIFSLDGWLTSTLAPLEVMARSKGLEFAWSVDRPGRYLNADRVKLGRILVNLAGNAVKFTESGSVEVAVRATPEDWLALSVHDTGPGIPDDQRDRIFDEFAQLRNPERDRTKGTGLGLAICRRLVEGVGGRLEVESRLGEGSTFTALFPPGHVLARAPRSARQRGEAEVSTVTDAPILLVEDDDYSRKALARLLEHAGYRVEMAADGPAALAALGRSRPALILLDLMMPGMDGIQVLQRIREAPAWKDLPVVVLSGDVVGSRTGELRALDVDGVLAKPVDFDALLPVVSRHAAHR